MSGQNPPRIDELYNRKFMLMLAALLAMTAVCAVIISNVWHHFDSTTHTIILIVFAMSGVMTIGLLLRLTFCRVRIDESGAEADNPISGSNHLAWSEIRTAAIVRITVGNQTADPLILLSSRDPEVALTHRALTTGKVLTKDEQLRIPLTPARRAAVEHYLHMTLPEYRI